MKDTFTGLGVVLMAAALIGAGFKAAGVDVPAIKSPWRQVAVFFFGLFVVGLANSGVVSGFIDPVRYATESRDDLKISPTLTHNIAFDVGRDGRVDVTLKSIVTHPTPGSTAGDTPELYLRLCGAGAGNNCAEGQRGIEGTIGADLKQGKATLYVFSFKGNPRITFSVEIVTPQKTML